MSSPSSPSLPRPLPDNTLPQRDSLARVPVEDDTLPFGETFASMLWRFN